MATLTTTLSAVRESLKTARALALARAAFALAVIPFATNGQWRIALGLAVVAAGLDLIFTELNLKTEFTEAFSYYDGPLCGLVGNGFVGYLVDVVSRALVPLGPLLGFWLAHTIKIEPLAAAVVLYAILIGVDEWAGSALTKAAVGTTPDRTKVGQYTDMRKATQRGLRGFWLALVTFMLFSYTQIVLGFGNALTAAIVASGVLSVAVAYYRTRAARRRQARPKLSVPPDVS